MKRAVRRKPCISFTSTQKEGHRKSAKSEETHVVKAAAIPDSIVGENRLLRVKCVWRRFDATFMALFWRLSIFLRHTRSLLDR